MYRCRFQVGDAKHKFEKQQTRIASILEPPNSQSFRTCLIQDARRPAPRSPCGGGEVVEGFSATVRQGTEWDAVRKPWRGRWRASLRWFEDPQAFCCRCRTSRLRNFINVYWRRIVTTGRTSEGNLGSWP